MSANTSKVHELRDAVNAALGAGTVRTGDDPHYRTTYTPTGLLPVDIILQGGLPRGRFIQISGDYSTLKSYVGLCAIAEYQRRGMTCAIIDTEHSFDASWATSIGIDVKDLIVEQPHTAELALDIMEVLIRGGVDLIIVDSIAAMAPQSETDKRLHKEKVQPARLAALMSTALRKLTSANTDSTVFWINQTRVNIGITFGSNEALVGGKAMPYYSSIMLSVRKVGKVTRDVKMYTGDEWKTIKEMYGQRYKIEITKSKLSKPFREIWFLWNLEEGGIDRTDFLLAQGIELGFINQKGNTWTYGNLKAVGRQKFTDLLRSDVPAKDALEDEIRGHHDVPLDAVALKRRTATRVPAAKEDTPKPVAKKAAPKVAAKKTMKK